LFADYQIEVVRGIIAYYSEPISPSKQFGVDCTFLLETLETLEKIPAGRRGFTANSLQALAAHDSAWLIQTSSIGSYRRRVRSGYGRRKPLRIEISGAWEEDDWLLLRSRELAGDFQERLPCEKRGVTSVAH
jgi:hypothetical protein